MRHIQHKIHTLQGAECFIKTCRIRGHMGTWILFDSSNVRGGPNYKYDLLNIEIICIFRHTAIRIHTTQRGCFRRQY
jgi:hypothetical protein